MSLHNESIPESTEVKGGSPFWMLAGILFIILVVVLGGMMLSNSGSATETEDTARAAVRMKNLSDLQAADATLLNSYGWVDQAKGIVHIPITRAMKLVLPTLNATPTPEPTPLPTPVPVAVPVVAPTKATVVLPAAIIPSK